jgi:hypothetical protein
MKVSARKPVDHLCSNFFFNSNLVTNPVTQAPFKIGVQPGSGFTIEQEDQSKISTIVLD